MSTSIADSGLRCPACAYNLTGLDTQRCPECGHAFDPDRLRRMLGGEPQPIPIWDDGHRSLPERFGRVCLLTWFRPAQVAKSLPACYHVASARRFRRVALGVALVVHVLGGSSLLGGNAGEAIAILCASGTGILVGATVTEALVLLACHLWLRRRDGQPIVTRGAGSNSWHAVISFNRSFLPANAAGFSATALLAASEVTDLSGLVLLAMVVVASWWWICLGRALAVVAEPTAGLVVVIALIPVLAAIAVFAALAFGLVVGLLLIAMFF